MTVNIYENHVCALRLKKRIWAILAVMNTTELVVEIRSEKKKKKKLSVTSLDRLCMLLESSDYFYRVDPVKNEASMKMKSIFVITYEITRDLGILL